VTAASELLTSLGLPTGDRHDLPASEHRFPDGAAYRIEIPSVEGPAAMHAVIDEADRLGVPVLRVSQGSGVMLLRDADIAEMVALGAARGVEVSLFVGPRAPWEGTAQALAPDGKHLGWRHTGMDQIAYAFDDVARAAALGIRSVLVADEGLLWLLDQARRRGSLPKNMIFKGSVVLGAANPLGIRLLIENGLNTINVSPDSSLARLAALRQVVAQPIDMYIEAPDSLGGFTRYHEIPDVVRVAAPVYLKFGLRNAPALYPSGAHLEALAVSTARERVRRAAIGLELLARQGSNFTTSKPHAAGLGVPESAL
jgi:hypothetical protein